MVWTWGRVAGDRIQGGVQFCWQVGHLLILVCVAWTYLAEVFWGFGEGPAELPGTSWDNMGLEKGLGDRIQEGVQFHWQAGHSPILAGMV